MVIIQPPSLDDLPRFGQTVEQMFVEAFVAQAAIEALDEGVLDRLARLDVMPGHAAGNPAQDGHTSQFATIVADYNLGRCALVGETFELAHDPHAAQGSIDHTGQAFTAEVIDDAENPKAPAVT